MNTNHRDNCRKQYLELCGRERTFEVQDFSRKLFATRWIDIHANDPPSCIRKVTANVPTEEARRSSD